MALDLKEPMDPETFEALEAALIEHKVIVVRDQHLTTEQHVEMSRMFGELEVHPMRPQGEFPEILVLDNHKDNPVLSTDVWHSDTTFRRNPTKYTILRCQIMPKVGGDTLWADMEAAYEGLSDIFRKMIDGLRAVHDFKNFRVLFKKTEEDQAKLRKMEELFPNPSHPVVRTHPVTGRKCIYVNPQFTLQDRGPEARRKPCNSRRTVRAGCRSRNISSGYAGRRARSCSGTTARPSTTPPTTITRTVGAWSAPPLSATCRTDRDAAPPCDQSSSYPCPVYDPTYGRPSRRRIRSGVARSVSTSDRLLRPAEHVGRIRRKSLEQLRHFLRRRWLNVEPDPVGLGEEFRILHGGHQRLA